MKGFGKFLFFFVFWRSLLGDTYTKFAGCAAQYTGLLSNCLAGRLPRKRNQILLTSPAASRPIPSCLENFQLGATVALRSLVILPLF